MRSRFTSTSPPFKFPFQQIRRHHTSELAHDGTSRLPTHFHSSVIHAVTPAKFERVPYLRMRLRGYTLSFPTSVSEVAFKWAIFFIASEQVTSKSSPPSPRAHHKERMLSRFSVISHMLISRVRLRYGPNNDHSSRLAAQMGSRLACADQQPEKNVQFHVPESFLDLSHITLHPRCFCLNSPASLWRSDLCDIM